MRALEMLIITILCFNRFEFASELKRSRCCSDNLPNNQIDKMSTVFNDMDDLCYGTNYLESAHLFEKAIKTLQNVGCYEVKAAPN